MIGEFISLKNDWTWQSRSSHLAWVHLNPRATRGGLPDTLLPSQTPLSHVLLLAACSRDAWRRSGCLAPSVSNCTPHTASAPPGRLPPAFSTAAPPSSLAQALPRITRIRVTGDHYVIILPEAFSRMVKWPNGQIIFGSSGFQFTH